MSHPKIQSSRPDSHEPNPKTSEQGKEALTRTVPVTCPRMVRPLVTDLRAHSPGGLETREGASTARQLLNSIEEAQGQCLLSVDMASGAAVLSTALPYLQNLSPAKMYVFLFLLQLKAASTFWTSRGSPRLVSGLGYPRSRVLAE